MAKTEPVGLKDPPLDNPGEDTTPRDTLPAQAQLPEKKPQPGWQSPPLEVAQPVIPCPHLGRLRAATEVHRYPRGTEWVCGCGQIFVVAINKGDKRTLIKKEDLEELAKSEPEPVEEQ